jgi:hypothetical protein
VRPLPAFSGPQPDFEAEVRFLTQAEGGRRSLPKQGYRIDVHWDDDSSNTIWMIWPKFLDSHGAELPEGADIAQTSRARFYIVSPRARPLLAEQGWLHDDARFHLTEGDHRVAACRVIKMLSFSHDAA